MFLLPFSFLSAFPISINLLINLLPTSTCSSSSSCPAPSSPSLSPSFFVSLSFSVLVSCRAVFGLCWFCFMPEQLIFYCNAFLSPPPPPLHAHSQCPGGVCARAPRSSLFSRSLSSPVSLSLSPSPCFIPPLSFCLPLVALFFNHSHALCVLIYASQPKERIREREERESE